MTDNAAKMIGDTADIPQPWRKTIEDLSTRIEQLEAQKKPTPEEAAKVLLHDEAAHSYIAIELMRQVKKHKGTNRGGYAPALQYALRSFAQDYSK